MINPPLSPEQKRVMEAYKLAYLPTLFVCVLIWLVATILISEVIRASGDARKPPGGGTMVLTIIASHIWTVRKLVRQGLSLASQKTEVLTRVASDPIAEAREWRIARTWLGLIGNASIPFLISGAGWFLWHWSFSPISWLGRGLGMLGFGLFGWWGIVELIFIRSAQVRIDSEGITAFPSPFWRRRARWDIVAICEIRAAYDYLGNGPSRLFTFKSAMGKALLRVSPASLLGLSPDEQAEIEAEIRRHMGHQPQNIAQ